MNQLRFAIVFCISGIAVQTVDACNIPVFRYALENWQPDNYITVILHNGNLTAEQQSLLEQIKAKSLPQQEVTNVNFYEIDQRTVDETNLPPGVATYIKRWADYASPTAPTMVVLYPEQLPTTLPAWSGPFSRENADRILDSPIRQEIARRVLEGESAVWVLIESGNKEVDDAAFARLGDLLKDAPNHVAIPDQDLIETDDEYNPSNKIELRVEFSALRISRDALDEAPFISMLLGSEEDLQTFNEPIAIPIFARGRTYFALVGRGINETNVHENCQFLCGACSCQVKQDNPGIDLPIAMNWNDHITESAMDDVALPELTGIGGFEVDIVSDDDLATSDEATDQVVASAQANNFGEIENSTEVASVPQIQNNTARTDSSGAGTAADTASRADSEPAFERRLGYWLVGLLGAGLVFAIGSTLLLKRSNSTG